MILNNENEDPEKNKNVMQPKMSKKIADLVDFFQDKRIENVPEIKKKTKITTNAFNLNSRFLDDYYSDSDTDSDQLFKKKEKRKRIKIKTKKNSEGTQLHQNEKIDLHKMHIKRRKDNYVQPVTEDEHFSFTKPKYLDNPRDKEYDVHVMHKNEDNYGADAKRKRIIAK